MSKIYINREIDFIIENNIENRNKKVIFVYGKGGVGKSTLLKKFLSYNKQKIPTILINLLDTKDTNFVDILLNRDITKVRNCKNFEKVRKIVTKEPKLLADILKAYNSEIETELKLVQKVDNEYGLVIRTLVDIVKIVAKFFARDYEARKKEIFENIEFALIEALKKDFSSYGIFMVDTLEKTKDVKIKSKVEFDGINVYSSYKDSNHLFRHYIEGLSNIFVENSIVIIAGRNNKNELNMDIEAEKIKELSLKNFSISNIKEFFTLYIKQNRKISMPTKKQIEHIDKLTNGNPLLIGLFPKVVEEYSSWDELDYNEMEKRVKTDDRYGLLFYMTDRVLSHLDNSSDIWKVVIPRVLNREIAKLLFGNQNILKRLIDVGLASRGEGLNANKYFLHDDVYRAIKAYFEIEFREDLSCWHDREEVATLHNRLIKFYKKRKNLDGVNSEFEMCYHKIMLRKDFEKDFKVKREEFANFTLGALYLSLNNKKRICRNWENIKQIEIKKYIQDLKNEKNRAIISNKLYNKFSQDFSLGLIDNLEDIDYLIKLSNNIEFKSDWSIFYVLGTTYGKKGEYNQAIEAFQKAININPNNRGAYTNLFELQLIQNQPFNQALEKKYIELFQNQKEIFIKYEMLKILQNIVQNKEVNIDGWVEKYRDISLSNWSFNELHKWINGIKDREIKKRLIEAIEIFEGGLEI